MKQLLILFIILIMGGDLYASCLSPDEGFWKNEQGRGWFWGQIECPTIIDNQSRTSNPQDNYSKWKILPQKANIPWDILDKIDPDEISTKIEPEAKKVSVMYPTEENITEYRKLTNWMVKKASQYATVDERIRIENPLLNPNIELAPISSIKSKALVSYKNTETDKILTQYKDRGGLIIYESATCQYCKLQKPIISSFQNDYGWEVVYRDVKQFPKETLQLGIKTTPDIFLVLKEQNGSGIKYQRIATGLTTLDMLKMAILKGLGYLGETINETLINY